LARKVQKATGDRESVSVLRYVMDCTGTVYRSFVNISGRAVLKAQEKWNVRLT